MSKVILILFLFISCSCFGQDWDSISKQADENTCEQFKQRIEQLENSIDILKGEIDLQKMTKIYVSGLRSIRHDAILRLKFHYAHVLKLEIEKL